MAKKVVIVVDGREYSATYIGKGEYSKVYRVGDRAVYYTRGDCGKEVLAMYQYDRMAHLPELVRHSSVKTSRTMWQVFSSPYYRDVRRTDTSAWTLMRMLVAYVEKTDGFLYRQGFRGWRKMEAIIDSMVDDGLFPHSIIKAMEEIKNVSANCGERVNFDLHEKNFGVNEYGTLIFRDPIYVVEER